MRHPDTTTDEMTVFLASGKKITFLREPERRYTPSEMLCLTKGDDITNEAQLQAAKNSCRFLGARKNG